MTSGIGCLRKTFAYLLTLLIETLCRESCKMAEPIEMQFGMLNRVGPGNMYYMGCRCLHRKGHCWGARPIEKHCKAYDLGVG